MDRILRALLLSLLLAAIVLPAGTAAAFAVRRPVKLSLGRLVRHGCARGAVRGYQVEPTAVTVGSSGSLVAAWQANRGTLGADAIVAATSSDGLTWSTAMVPRLSRCSGGTADAVSDPWLASGPDGILYLSAATLVVRTGRPTGAILVTRSVDAGHSWQRPVVLSRDPGSVDDKPTITADPYRPGVAFLVWDKVGKARALVVSRTVDGGRSWSPPRVLARTRDNHDLLFPEIGVMPNEALTLVYAATPHHVGAVVTMRHVIRASKDLGLTWSAPRAIDRLRTVPEPAVFRPSSLVRGSGVAPSLGSGPEGLYLVSALVDSRSRTRLVIARERADGTWTAPRTILATARLLFLPTVAANANGDVAVTWYSVASANPSGKVPATVMAAVSSDQGRTWKIAPVGQSPALPRLADGELFTGDYQGLATTPAGFNAIYITSPLPRRPNRTQVISQAFG